MDSTEEDDGDPEEPDDVEGSPLDENGDDDDVMELREGSIEVVDA